MANKEGIVADIAVVFLKSGESPEIGGFEVAQERSIPDHIAKVFRDRKICKYKKQEMAKKPKKGVSGDGG